ncbi:MAG: DUF3137 domain-containing protein [Fuerstiella sp.]|nr:DUF3137 domain-containing protein [Fuerstiella sp.]
MGFYSWLTGRDLTPRVKIGNFVETEPYETGFAAHYDSQIAPLVEKFENSRILALRQARIRLFFAFAIAICFVSFVILLANINPGLFDRDSYTGPACIFAALCLVISLGMWVSNSVTKYKQSIKSEIFPLILSHLGDYHFMGEIGNCVSDYKDSEIIPTYDTEHSEDGISGEYKGVSLDLFETALTYTTSGGSNKTTHTTFDGVVVSLSMNKRFKGKTIVRADVGDLAKACFKFADWLERKSFNLRAVRLEDPRFDKLFDVYSSDQVEARYLLTTSFMERLLDLRRAYSSKWIQCSFYDNKLLVLIWVSHNMFEPGSIFKHEDFIDDSKSLLKEMASIFKIVDTLKLDQDIGL